MQLRKYREQDLPEIYRLFYATVHRVNGKDYSPSQLDAWAPPEMDAARWEASLAEHFTLVAVCGEQIAGFGDITDTGYLDRLYVHPDHIGTGVGHALLDGLEQYARRAGADKIYTEASITARPFFEKHGYRVIAKQQKPLRGEIFINFTMEKAI